MSDAGYKRECIVKDAVIKKMMRGGGAWNSINLFKTAGRLFKMKDNSEVVFFYFPVQRG